MDPDSFLKTIEADAEERFATPSVPESLTILYDPNCALCRRCSEFMLGQPSYVRLEFMACTGAQARAEYGNIPWLGDELVVVGDKGEIWVGPAAFLTCLWALVEWRSWSYRLAGEAFAPLAERFFYMLSARRRSLSALFEKSCRDGACQLR